MVIKATIDNFFCTGNKLPDYGIQTFFLPVINYK